MLRNKFNPTEVFFFFLFFLETFEFYCALCLCASIFNSTRDFWRIFFFFLFRCAERQGECTVYQEFVEHYHNLFKGQEELSWKLKRRRNEHEKEKLVHDEPHHRSEPEIQWTKLLVCVCVFQLHTFLRPSFTSSRFSCVNQLGPHEKFEYYFIFVVVVGVSSPWLPSQIITARSRHGNFIQSRPFFSSFFVFFSCFE